MNDLLDDWTPLRLKRLHILAQHFSEAYRAWVSHKTPYSQSRAAMNARRIMRHINRRAAVPVSWTLNEGLLAALLSSHQKQGNSAEPTLNIYLWLNVIDRGQGVWDPWAYQGFSQAEAMHALAARLGVVDAPPPDYCILP